MGFKIAKTEQGNRDRQIGNSHTNADVAVQQLQKAN
jgi:hypothetical protein